MPIFSTILNQIKDKYYIPYFITLSLMQRYEFYFIYIYKNDNKNYLLSVY